MPRDAYPVLPRPARRPPFSVPVIALLVAIALGAAACSSGTANTHPPRNSSAAVLYQAGHEAMLHSEFGEAADRFRTLEALYPDDASTLQGQVELVYAYYKQGDTASALGTAERFIRDHPDHPSLDYVHYLRGLALFNEAMEALGQDSVEIRPRPPTADLAMEYFSTLIQRFPASKYAADARNRILHLQNGLATFELATAKIYLNRGDYINAGLHARAVVENYPEAGVKTEAVTVANMAYRMLDLQSPSPASGFSITPAPADAIRPEVEITAPAPAGPKLRAESTTPDPAPSEPASAAASIAQAEIATATPGRSDTGTTSSAPTPGGITAQREDWIEQQDPRAYTLQLLSVSDHDALLAFIRAHPLDNLAYFETRREGFPWYSLIHGIFPDTAAARTAAEALPAKLNLPQPWIRRLGEIQTLIAAHRARTVPPE